MNRKATAPVRGQKPRLKLPCSVKAAVRIIKFPRPNRALLFSRLWQCASGNPAKCFHIRARLRPKICRLNRLFPPIVPDSIEHACGERECSGRRFDDGIAARLETVTAAAVRRNPIYVLFPACLLADDSDKFNTQSN